jgi:hypothetical protein
MGQYSDEDVAALIKEVRLLRDRAEIRDAISSYCRAFDRQDWELLSTGVYHTDAFDDHGSMVATPKQLYDHFSQDFRNRHQAVSHMVLNSLYDIDGDVAHAETYFIAFTLLKDGSRVDVSYGRYIDRLERRDGKWRIAVRRLATEARISASDVQVNNKVGTWDKSDPSYERPLTLPPERRALTRVD